MAQNMVAVADREIKEYTAKLESMGFEVKRQGLRTKVYREKQEISKWLEVRQLIGFARYWLRKASPMEIALLNAGMVRQSK